MIYKEFCHEQITVHGELPMVAKSERNGVWLQHSTASNALAILAASRQTYEEGRRILYGLNSYIFRIRSSIPTLLVSIGRHNAMLLRSVQYKEWGRLCHEWIDILRPFLMPVPAVYQQTEEGLNSNDAVSKGIWTNKGAFQGFLDAIGATLYRKGYPDFGKRLMRFEDAGDPVADDVRMRNKLYVTFGRETGASARNGVVAYELVERIVTKVEDC